jgi:4-amino-4-deoxy-L-arabinose transferase-like glycosyltransferase
MNNDSLLLVFIIGLALFLRIWDIGWNGFNGDESIYSGQAASLLGNEEFTSNFAVFRAHPLLLQSLVSIAFALLGIQDTTARIVPVIFGTLTVFVTYLVAKQLFNKKIGLICSLVLALMPFHIVFSRQVIVDVPLSFFVVLFLYFITRYRETGTSFYCYLTGVSCGLCFISKEVGIITLPIFLVYTFLTHSLKLNKIHNLFLGFVSAVFPYFFLILTRQDASNAFYQYAMFQLERYGHGLSFKYYSILINEAFGYVLFILCIASALMIWIESRKPNSKSYRDQVLLLGLTLGAFFLFYQLLPSTGDRFMVTLIAPGIILGCSILVTNTVKHMRLYNFAYIIIVPLIIFSTNLFLSKVFPIEDLRISDGLGTPWKREASLWIKNNTPANAGILTDNMPFANIIRFYSHHDVYAVTLSPNPSYLQVDNPAFLFLNNNISIVVQDLDPLRESKSTRELVKYLQFSDPKLVYTAYRHTLEDGKEIAVPMIRVYKVN